MNGNIKLGYALCGSFCTFKQSFGAMEALSAEGYDIYPIMSENAYSTDTRFGKASDWAMKIENLCGKPIIHTISAAEPIGPKGLFDLLVICPLTGNSLSKLANAVTDTAVTMAAKAHLRNERPLLLSISSNDALGMNAENLGRLLAARNIYFVPFRQDDPAAKPRSLTAEVEQLPEAVKAALQGRQLQPVIRA